MADITTYFVQQYKAGIQLLNQQMGSKLLPYVRREDQQGESAFYDQLAPTTVRPVTTRFEPKVITEPDHRRRRVTLVNREVTHLIDRFDEARFLNNPRGPYTQSQAMAIGREHDKYILAQAIGTAYTGKTGADSESLGTDQQITATGALDLDDLREIRRRLRSVNLWDEIHMAVTADEMDDLLAITQLQSVDFNSDKVLVGGKVARFMGINFHELDDSVMPEGGTPGTTRYCVAWVKSGVLFASNPEIEVNISRRDDLTGSPLQVESLSIFGATRMASDWVLRVETTISSPAL